MLPWRGEGPSGSGSSNPQLLREETIILPLIWGIPSLLWASTQGGHCSHGCCAPQGAHLRVCVCFLRQDTKKPSYLHSTSWSTKFFPNYFLSCSQPSCKTGRCYWPHFIDEEMEAQSLAQGYACRELQI